MTNLDIGFGILLLVFLIWGMAKGLLWTLIRLASLAGVIVIISSFGEEYRYKLGELIKVSPAVATAITYLLIFLIMIILGQIVYGLCIKLVKKLKLGCLNRIAGGFFAVVEYLLLLAMIVILIDISPLSLNGRGVRPENYRSNFKEYSKRLEAEINKRRANISEMNLDRLWEGLDEAKANFEKAKDKETRNLAIKDLYETMQSTLGEEDFTEVDGIMQQQQKETMKFKGNDIVVRSFIIETLIEPIADYIETEIMGLSSS